MRNLNEMWQKIEERRGEAVSVEEREFAIEQLLNNRAIANIQKIYDDTAMDILDTNVDFFRRHKLCKQTQ